MLVFKFLSELVRKYILTLIFLHLFLTHDVVTMRGLTMEEVEIVGPPCDTCAEIICTIATIEPANSDSKYEKYIADSCQANLLEGVWQYKPNATTFEKCASAADSDGSKIFLFNDDQCKISPFSFEKTNQCNGTQSQMVYIEADSEAEELFKRKLTCDSDVVIACVDGKMVHKEIVVNNSTVSCEPKLKNSASYDAGYIFFTPDYELPRSDITAECEKYGAVACAPKQGENITAFIEDLEDYFDVLGESSYVVGLHYNDSAATFTWVTGVNQPTTPKGQNGWMPDHPKLDYTAYTECARVQRDGISTAACHYEGHYCCLLQKTAE